MKAFNKIALLLLSLTFFSCDDILEEDITDKTATIVTPQEGAIIESNVVNFQWNSMEGADKYRIQVFNDNQVIVQDSLVELTSLILPLEEGNYQWRVRGENFGYQSSYSLTVGFQVDESEDLTSQLVILDTPQDNMYTNSPNFTVSWNSLSAADYYQIQIVNVTNSNTIVFQQSNITGTSYTLNSSILSTDAKYQWRVKAFNTSSETLQYASRFFHLDTVLPNQPQNTLPANNSNQLLNQAVNFSWTIPVDSGTIQTSISYVVEIATDSAFTNIIQTSPIASQSFQRTFNTSGDYYWRVRAIDAVGNIGINSSYFKITVN